MFCRSRFLFGIPIESLKNLDRIFVIPQMWKRERRSSESEQRNPARQTIARKRVHTSDLLQDPPRPCLKAHSLGILQIVNFEEADAGLAGPFADDGGVGTRRKGGDDGGFEVVAGREFRLVDLELGAFAPVVV